jgi:hypothetical protein
MRKTLSLLLLWSMAPSSEASVTDSTVRLPPLYNTFVPPAAGLTYVDQTFGTLIKRLSDAVNTPNHATSGNLLWIGTEYPTASPFNANNSWLILQHQGYHGLYDGSGVYVRDLPFSVNASAEPRWSRTDPNVLFYVSGNKLMRLDVATGTSTTIRVFPEYSAIRGRGESDISRDGDHFVFAGDAPGGLPNRYVFVYKISSNTKGAVLDTIGHAFNQLYLAPDNSVAIGWVAVGTTRFTGIELFDRNMVFQRQLTHAIGHMHLTRDNNDDVLIWANSDDPQPIPNCQNGIVKVKLSNGQQTCLLQLDWSLAVHITAGDGDGWVFVETYDPTDPPASSPPWKPYTNEIIQVKLDGSETRRLLHHRSRKTAIYEYQPRATVSRDGSTLVYSSTYNLQDTPGHAFGYTDAYMVAVPGSPPPHISIADASVVEGNSGTTSLIFTVSLSHVSDQPVTVSFQTQDGTATAPGDYTATGPQTLTFPPMTATRTISVPVQGDTMIELGETVLVVLSNPTNADITGPSGVGTILNDDLPAMSIGDVSVLEGNSGTTAANFVVTLSANFSQAITVSFATSNGSALGGTDYEAATGTLTIPAGATSGVITVMILGDTILESNETFSVTLFGPINATLATAKGVGTIQNDDVGKTVCATGCDFARIQDAINASGPGGSVLVRSTYDSFTAGEVFPIQTLAINQTGAIAITGETDGGGNLITTVKTKSGPVDGFNIVSPGSLLRDLRIVPGDATRVNRVITGARNPGSCPGAACHLNGLTIRNVVIDFSTTFNTGNGIDVSADNVWIDKVTIKGIAGTSILVDGTNATIKDNILDGRDLNGPLGIRGALAIGFGADQKQTGAPCSGFPTNYLVHGNTILGYADGIRWCSGRNNTVSANTLTNISGKGIDTSGSQGTQIFENVLQQITTGGAYGIGLFGNAFQACSGNTVRNNKVLGRPARDLAAGIMVQGCADTTIFQNEVRDFADGLAAIHVTMAKGVATKTTIQGNTVIGGNGEGIVYFGADEGATSVDQSVIRDNVVNEFRRNGIVVQRIKGARTGAGAGNVVAYNTVRVANLANVGNTHAFNLQNLANTAFDRNTALATTGGYGFFLANTTGVNGNCNTGAANGAGLFGQANVTPTYGNANVNCRVALYSHYDFDGDGRSDVTMYRHTTGEWFMKNSSNGADSVIAFGAAGSDDIPAPGSYTVGGKTDIAIYRYTTGEWYIRRATDGGTTVIQFGIPTVGDLPMPADYDGDGLTDLAVFRVSTANAEWYIRRSSDGVTQYVAWGCSACADVGVPGDYDGDGKADVAVYRRSTGEWFVRKSSDTTLQKVAFGDAAQGDIPVSGRYTQAGKTDMAVYRSLTGEFFIRRSTDFGTTVVPIGVPSAGDFPVAADFTQSGITDIAIYRPTPPTAAFLIRRSTDFGILIIPYGNPGSQDAPLTAR